MKLLTKTLLAVHLIDKAVFVKLINMLQCIYELNEGIKENDIGYGVKIEKGGTKEQRKCRRKQGKKEKRREKRKNE